MRNWSCQLNDGKLRYRFDHDLTPFLLWSYEELEHDIPQWGSLDRSCEVMVREFRRHIDPCPGCRATYQTVSRPGATPTARTEHRLICSSHPGHGSICCLNSLTITSHDLSSEPHCGISCSNSAYDHRRKGVKSWSNRSFYRSFPWSFSLHDQIKLGNRSFYRSIPAVVQFARPN